MPEPIVHSLPARAAVAIVDRVGRRIVLAIPVGIGKPNLLVNALYGMALADRSITLRILTGLSLVRPAFKSDVERRFVAPLLDRLFGSWPDLAYVEAIRKGTLPSNVEVHEFFLQAGQWLSNSRMQQSYASLSYAHVTAHLEREGVNVLAQLVAKRPDGRQDRLSLSSNPDIALDLKPYVERRRRSGEPIVTIGEINDNLPYMTGDADIAASEMDFLLEPARPHFELLAPPKEPVSLADYAMALHAATMRTAARCRSASARSRMHCVTRWCCATRGMRSSVRSWTGSARSRRRGPSCRRSRRGSMAAARCWWTAFSPSSAPAC